MREMCGVEYKLQILIKTVHINAAALQTVIVK